MTVPRNCRLFEAGAGSGSTKGLGADAVHDAGHVGLVRGAFVGGPEIGVGGRADGRHHLVQELTQPRIPTALLTVGLAGLGVVHGPNVGKSGGDDKGELSGWRSLNARILPIMMRA